MEPTSPGAAVPGAPARMRPKPGPVDAAAVEELYRASEGPIGWWVAIALFVFAVTLGIGAWGLHVDADDNSLLFAPFPLSVFPLCFAMVKVFLGRHRRFDRACEELGIPSAERARVWDAMMRALRAHNLKIGPWRRRAVARDVAARLAG